MFRFFLTGRTLVTLSLFVHFFASVQAGPVNLTDDEKDKLNELVFRVYQEDGALPLPGFFSLGSDFALLNYFATDLPSWESLHVFYEECFGEPLDRRTCLELAKAGDPAIRGLQEELGRVLSEALLLCEQLQAVLMVQARTNDEVNELRELFVELCDNPVPSAGYNRYISRFEQFYPEDDAEKASMMRQLDDLRVLKARHDDLSVQKQEREERVEVSDAAFAASQARLEKLQKSFFLLGDSAPSIMVQNPLEWDPVLNVLPSRLFRGHQQTTTWVHRICRALLVSGILHKQITILSRQQEGSIDFFVNMPLDFFKLTSMPADVDRMCLRVVVTASAGRLRYMVPKLRSESMPGICYRSSGEWYSIENVQLSSLVAPSHVPGDEVMPFPPGFEAPRRLTIEPGSIHIQDQIADPARRGAHISSDRAEKLLGDCAEKISSRGWPVARVWGLKDLRMPCPSLVVGSAPPFGLFFPIEQEARGRADYVSRKPVYRATAVLSAEMLFISLLASGREGRRSVLSIFAKMDEADGAAKAVAASAASAAPIALDEASAEGKAVGAIPADVLAKTRRREKAEELMAWMKANATVDLSSSVAALTVPRVIPELSGFSWAAADAPAVVEAASASSLRKSPSKMRRTKRKKKRSRTRRSRGGA